MRLSVIESIQRLFGGGAAADEEQARRALTANEFVNVKDVRGPVLYSKDGLIFAYLKITPISLELLSPREQFKKIRSFAAEFSSERKPFKFFSISRPVDISGLSAWLGTLLRETDNPIRKELILDEMREISAFAVTGEIIERQFFLIIWEHAGNAVDGEKELLRRANDLENKFSSCEMIAELCGQETVIRLLNLFANPNYAHLEDSSVSPTIPFIKEPKRGDRR